MKVSFFILAFAFASITNISIAQPYFDLFSFQGLLTQPTELVSNNKFDVKTEWMSAQLSYPLLFKDKFILAVTMGYDKWNLKSTGSTQHFQSGYVPVSFIKPVSDKWKISITCIPRFSDEAARTLNDKTWQLGGALIATRKISDHLSLKGGLYYNKEFFGNLFLPLIGGEWKLNDRLYVFGLLPNNLFIDYKFSKTFHGGFIYKGITTSFRLKQENYYDYIRLEEGQLKFFTDCYLTKNLVINIEIGHTVAREYSFGFMNKKGNSAAFNDGSLLKAGLYYRMWL